MSVKPETQLVQKIILAIRGRYPRAFVRKVHGGPYQSGLPDLHVVLDGRAAWLEVKVPGNQATKLQAAVLAALKRAGAITGVVTSPDEALDVLACGLSATGRGDWSAEPISEVVV